MAKPQHISEVYASQLEDFCQGYPLWSPSGPEGADEMPYAQPISASDKYAEKRDDAT